MILVTGATGILGRVIVLDLLKQGKSVRATKRKTSNLEEVRKSFQFYTENPDEWFKKIQWIDVDFTDSENLKIILENVEEVYHTSAKVSFHPKNRKELYKTNISATKKLLYACENSSVKKFCFISSIAVLDGLNEDGKMDEDSDYNSKLDHSDYAVSKHFSEMEVWRSSAEGLNIVIVNPGIIIGSGNWNQSSGTLFKTFEKQNFTFSGGSSYVDVRDVAEISIDLMEKNIFGQRFILISENLKYPDFGKLVREKLNLKPQKIVPKFLLNTGFVLNKLLGWLISPLQMVTKSNIEAITTFNEVSNEKIKKEMNYTFIPVKESVGFHLKNYLKDKK